jgi:hypothetical protein
LEDRILNRARLARSGIQIQGGRLLFAIGATLALSCLFLVSLEYGRIEPKREVVAVARIEPRLRAAPVALPMPRHTPIGHRRLRRLPKRDVFPTLQPPSAEEQTLLRFIERNPTEAAQAFANLQRQMDEPLEIQPLEIKPLQTDSVNN